MSDFVETPDSDKIIKLKDNLGKMQLRTRSCVIRWHKKCKLTNPEDYFLTLLQLYLPWTNENQLRHADGSYESKFEEVKDDIHEAMQNHQAYDEIDIESLVNHPESNSDSDNDDADIGLNPDNLDISDEEIDKDEDTIDNDFTLITTVKNILISKKDFCKLCAQLNAKQRELFNYSMKYIQRLRYSPESEPFYIFLSGGGGVGKSFFIHVLSEYAKRHLKYQAQSLKQPSMYLTASTGKAASNIDGTTLHSAFHLHGRKLQKLELANYQAKFYFLKIIVLDEVSMIDFDLLQYLDTNLQAIMKNKKVFGGVSILAVGDLLQLPPIGTEVFSFPKNPTIDHLKGCNWDLFKFYEFTEIVRQSGDPEFASILSRIREGKHTKDDELAIETNSPDISKFPKDAIKLFGTNMQAKATNNQRLTEIGNPIYNIDAKDSHKISAKTPLKFTGSLPSNIRICVGARFMLSMNLDIDDHLINGSIGTIKHIHMNQRNPLNGKFYVHFDNPKSGTNKRNRRINQNWVEIAPVPKTFKLGGRSIKRIQFPGIVAFAITIHKSQGGTYDYMYGFIDNKFNKPGMAYTMLSRAKTRSGLQLDNFKCSLIKTNQKALQEIERLRKESPLEINHSLLTMKGPNVFLLNIERSWNSQIVNVLADPIYFDYCSIFCFTETKANEKEIIM